MSNLSDFTVEAYSFPLVIASKKTHVVVSFGLPLLSSFTFVIHLFDLIHTFPRFSDFYFAILMLSLNYLRLILFPLEFLGPLLYI